MKSKTFLPAYSASFLRRASSLVKKTREVSNAEYRERVSREARAKTLGSTWSIIYKMIDISEAIRIISKEVVPLGTERAPVGDCAGRTLGADAVADSDLPPFDRSQMDGFAVISADTKKAPVSLKIVGESAAGSGWHKTMKPGEAVRIMTGAPLPAGADAVQKVELTREGAGDQIEIVETADEGRHIIRKGAEIKKGETVFRAGEVISDNMIAALAAFGHANIKVGKRPRVGVIGTGSEIVEIDKKPGRDQIRNSNSVMLDVFSRRSGGVARIFPIAKDSVADLKASFKQAAAASDILVITGGVSVGKYDHTKTALAELGAQLFFEKIALKPGKPAVFARLGKTLVFGLPGNPVSAAVTFHLFVRKAILLMQGAALTDLAGGFAALGSDVKAAANRDTYLPARLETDPSGQLIAHTLKWQGSSDFVGFSRADSLIFVPRGAALKKGAVARIAYL